jgi:hypothetical protein
MRALVLCALVACTYPDKQFEGPFTCLGAPPPTTADPLVKLTGTAINPSDKMPLAGVTVVLQDAQMHPVFTAMTDATGKFNFSLNTNGTPANGFDLFASGTGRVNTYYYPSRSITQDLAITLAVLSTAEASNLLLGATGMPLKMGDGAILMTINDCNGIALAGATLTSSPVGDVRYFDGIQPNPIATATDAGGVAMVANLPPGKATLTAKVMGNTLPARSFTVVADTFVQTLIQP